MAVRDRTPKPRDAVVAARIPGDVLLRLLVATTGGRTRSEIVATALSAYLAAGAPEPRPPVPRPPPAPDHVADELRRCRGAIGAAGNVANQIAHALHAASLRGEAVPAAVIAAIKPAMEAHQAAVATLLDVLRRPRA